MILKTLFSGMAQWVIFPEGMKVKNKKLVRKNQLALSDDRMISRLHTGAAIIAFRCEFYWECLRRMKDKNKTEFNRIIKEFEIKTICPI
jgi:hypothetical protein